MADSRPALSTTPIESHSNVTTTRRALRAGRGRNRQRISGRPRKLANPSDLELQSEDAAFDAGGVKATGRISEYTSIIGDDKPAT